MTQKCDWRRIGICIVLVSMIVLSGCVTVSVNSEVNSDGTIESYEINMTMSQMVYGLMQRSASENGYSSVKEYLLSDINKSQAKKIEYEEKSSDGNKTVTIRFKNFKPSGDGSISIKKKDGMMTYKDRTFMGTTNTTQQGSSSKINVEYKLTMPGKIKNSTADSVDGDTATWELSGSNESRLIYAKSEISSGLGLLAIAGIGIGGLLIIAIAIGAFLFYRSDGLSINNV
jgi:hypothetical protein